MDWLEQVHTPIPAYPKASPHFPRRTPDIKENCPPLTFQDVHPHLSGKIVLPRDAHKLVHSEMNRQHLHNGNPSTTATFPSHPIPQMARAARMIFSVTGVLLLPHLLVHTGKRKCRGETVLVCCFHFRESVDQWKRGQNYHFVFHGDMLKWISFYTS